VNDVGGRWRVFVRNRKIEIFVERGIGALCNVEEAAATGLLLHVREINLFQPQEPPVVHDQHGTSDISISPDNSEVLSFPSDLKSLELEYGSVFASISKSAFLAEIHVDLPSSSIFALVGVCSISAAYQADPIVGKSRDPAGADRMRHRAEAR